MRKRLVLFLTIISLCFFQCNNVYALDKDEIFSNEALIVDLNTDDVLFSKNTNDDPVPIASLTKIMTYAIVVENIDDLENTKVEVPIGTESDISAKGGSTAKLKDGYSYNALDLLYGLMLPSGCDAADVLAKHVSNDDYDKFVELMQKKADELGMVNTKFYNASGLEENGNHSVSTEQDLYKLAKYVLDLPYFKKIIKTEFYTLTGYKDDNKVESTVQNTNYMMGEYNGAEYYYQYSEGGKTGNLSVAGRCLISFAQKGNLEVVAITLGVPQQHSNYHLKDHRILFEYAFNEYTENIEVDIGSEYKSVGIGEKIQINASTSAETEILWESSDDEIASVNEYGIVTGKKIGQVKITATTKTGNQDYTYVSVGFYNGVDLKYSSGPNDSNGILGYGKIDWSIFKESGIDFAVIRAGYALNNVPDSDPYFVENIKGAVLNDIDIMVSFDSYALNKTHAKSEAEYLINYLNNNIKDYLNKIELPIVYNLTTSSASSSNLKSIIYAFKEVMEDNGYSIVIEFEKSDILNIDLEIFNNLDIGFYYVWRPYVPDFSIQKYFTKDNIDYNADLWQYRSDAYFGLTGIAKKTKMLTMYMDYKNINTNHEKHDDCLYVDKNDLRVDNEYIYSGKEISANVIGYNSNTMEIEGHIAKDVGIYTITIKPKTKWIDGSKDIVTLTWSIKKADPIVEVPLVSGNSGESLENIKLPKNWEWKDKKQVINSENNKFIAIYMPEDSFNYNTLEKELEINVIANNKVNENENTNVEKESTNVEKESTNVEKESTNVAKEVKEKYYKILDKYVYKRFDNKDLIISISGDSPIIEEVLIDNKKIYETEYIIEDSKIIIDFSYLDSLQVRDYLLKIKLRDKELVSTVSIVGDEVVEETITKNNDNNYKKYIVLTASFVVVALLGKIFIKKEN